MRLRETCTPTPAGRLTECEQPAITKSQLRVTSCLGLGAFRHTQSLEKELFIPRVVTNENLPTETTQPPHCSSAAGQLTCRYQFSGETE